MCLKRLLDSAILALFACLLLLSGCENTIEPFSEQATYSVYGVLSLDQTRQFVRVRSLEAPLDGDTTRSLDVTVTLQNLRDGSSKTLQDSIIVFKDASSRIVTHNFWTDLSVQPETEYRLTVEDDDGTTTTATTTTPSRVVPNLIPSKGNCRTDFRIEFRGVKNSRKITDVSLRFEGKSRDFRFQIDASAIFDADHGRPDHAFAVFNPENLLSQSLGTQADDPSTPCVRETHCKKLASKEISIRFTHLGKDWLGTLPEDTLITNPLNTPQVTNGSGFFGSIGRGRAIAVTDTTEISVDSPTCP